jgi:hypothetical protein
MQSLDKRAGVLPGPGEGAACGEQESHDRGVGLQCLQQDRRARAVGQLADSCDEVLLSPPCFLGMGRCLIGISDLRVDLGQKLSPSVVQGTGMLANGGEVADIDGQGCRGGEYRDGRAGVRDKTGPG